MIKLKTYLVICMLLLSSVTVLGWSSRTHTEIIQLTREYLDEGIFPDLYTFVNTYRGETYSGSTFPDWALAVINDTLSWHAHTLRFGNLYINHLIEKYPDMSTTEAKRELAFCLGMLSHIYSDRIWHGGTGEHSCLREGMIQDATTEEIIEGSLDIIIAYEYSISSFSWFWPLETIDEVYEIYGDPEVDEDMLNLGTSGIEVVYASVLATGYLSYISATALIPWTYDNYWDYYPGCIENCASLTALQMQRAWALVMNGDYVYQRSHYNCGYELTRDVHLLADYPTNNTGGEDQLTVTSDDETGHGATLLRWELDLFDTALVQIDSAKIFMYYYGSIGLSGDKQLSVYQVNRLWNQGTNTDGSSSTFLGSTQSAGDNLACWTHARYDESPWDIAGVEGVPGDRYRDYVDIKTFGTSTPEQDWYSWDVTPMVRTWNLEPSSNQGLLLKEELNTATGVLLFTSRESREDFDHPVLVVFTSPQEVSCNENDNNPIPLSFEIKAYPNPFNSICYFSTHSGSRLKIFNYQGHLVKILEGENLSWKPSISLSSGTYFILAEKGNQIASTRLVYLK